jgi:DNA uptake protein ComE-like DNA-binding protein
MKIKDYFIFNREQRIGLLILVCLIIIIQIVYFFVDFSTHKKTAPQDEKWLSIQTEIDSLKHVSGIDAHKIYPFNPNFIDDYKGYKLGLKIEEIDRLLTFRKTNKYVNSAKEFQDVTKISDSLLRVIAPFFKFPDWVKNKKANVVYEKSTVYDANKDKKITIIDINLATKEDLIKIYGIGDAISERILKQKEKVGAFVSMDQMEEIWGLSPEVVANLKQHFKILTIPSVKKLDINNASIKELSKFSYFNYNLAKEIVTYRSMNGEIKNIEDLVKIKGFPVEKIKIIALYLEFQKNN